MSGFVAHDERIGPVILSAAKNLAPGRLTFQ